LVRLLLEAPPEELFWRSYNLWLLYFLLKNGSFKKTFGRASLKEPEPKLERSLAKQVVTFP